MRNPNEVFSALSKSAFRSRFRLQGKDLDYLHAKGLPEILEHARNFVAKRLAAAEPANDGKQTPFRGHPVFVAQHATACCCRSCLQQWHRIPKSRALTEAEQTYIVDVLERWLRNELGKEDHNESANSVASDG